MKPSFFNYRMHLFTSMALLCFGSQTLRSQATYSFTTGGATGANGPTQGQLNTAYLSTTLNGSVVALAGIQSFTVPSSGAYQIEAWGGSGGNRSASTQLGGFGVSMIGTFNLVQGDVLKILVGQKGVDGANTASGGGGSFVEKNGTLLIAAGAGGGATGDNNAANGTTLTAGTVDFPGGSIPGGSGGSGGQVCNSSGTNHGGAGGGYTGNGATSTLGNAGIGGLSFTNGGTGGGSPVPGAFGGGGGATAAGVALYGGGGGGGGYSGGAGGQQVNHCTPGINRSGGGGGGSYNSGTNQINSILTAQGDGKVVITSICNISLTTPVNPICIGSTITLSTNAVSGILWSSGSTASSISVNPTVTTTYTVNGTASSGCVYFGVLTVTVAPSPSISTVVSPTLICVGNSATVTASGANTYSWTNGPVGSTSTLSPVVSSVYNLTATSIYGCVNTATFMVNVNSNSLTATPSTTLCKGNSLTLTASGAVTYTWSNGYLFSTVPVSPLVNTIYTITATDAFNCKLFKTVAVSVVDPPTVNIVANKTTVCKNESVVLTANGADTYTWNSGTIGPVASYTLPVDISYNYTVTGTDNLTGCKKSSSITISVVKCTGVGSLDNLPELLSLSPNPSYGLFTLKFAIPVEELVVEVYNDLGVLLRSQKIKGTESELDIRSEMNGVYFARIYDKKHLIKTIKMVKD